MVEEMVLLPAVGRPSNSSQQREGFDDHNSVIIVLGVGSARSDEEMGKARLRGAGPEMPPGRLSKQTPWPMSGRGEVEGDVG